VRSNPGVTEDRADRQGRSTALTVYGSTSAENNFLVDGVDTTNVIRGLQGKVINNEFIQEVEVKTDSYRAEYGNATGGIINVITKSGGNTFSGSVFGRYNSASLRADQVFTANDSDTSTGTLTPEEEKWDYGVNLGGFIVKDRLWFFGAYNRITDDQLISPPRGVVAGQDLSPRRRGQPVVGKAHVERRDGATLVGTRLRRPGNAGRRDPDAQLDGSRLLPRAPRHRRHRLRRTRERPLRQARPPDAPGVASQRPVRADRHRRRQRDPVHRRDRAAAVPRHRRPRAHQRLPGLQQEPPRPVHRRLRRVPANHEVKVGGAYIQRATEAIDLFTGGQQVAKRIDEDSGTTYYAHTFFGSRLGGGDAVPVPFNDVHLRSNDYAAFVQDSWKALHNLTIDAGLRFDRTDIKGFDGRSSPG
jgi:outer membrane receptor protein involved in Fe transport